MLWVSLSFHLRDGQAGILLSVARGANLLTFMLTKNGSPQIVKTNTTTCVEIFFSNGGYSMAKNIVNLQDGFLNQIRKDGKEIKLIFVDGTSLAGVVKGFDNFTIFLNSKGAQHLVYKHSIAQMISGKRPQSSRPKNNSENSKKPQSFNPIDISKVSISTPK